MSTPIYQHFLGSWILDPRTCDYEQGAPPISGRYQIEERVGMLRLTVSWIDSDGTSHDAELAGRPDGKPAPFPGGDLADALAITAVSPRELNSHAYFRGVERMVAQRQLDATLAAMRVTQIVRVDGGSLANVAIYKRQVLN